jgi:hypothetical protein
MFKGYELGIVYLFSPEYIEWCVDNIDGFCVLDLNELKEYSVFNKKLNFRYMQAGDPSLIPNIDAFKTIDELLENIDVARGDENGKYPWNDDLLLLNENRASVYQHERTEEYVPNDYDDGDEKKDYQQEEEGEYTDEDDGYDDEEDDDEYCRRRLREDAEEIENEQESRTYDEFGGINGWSDQDIYTIFDGNPDAAWNVD